MERDAVQNIVQRRVAFMTLTEQLEDARLAKQHAEPRTDAWYDADARIEQIARALYAGRSIDIDAQHDDDESDDASL